MAIYERMTVKGKGGSVQTYTPQQGATVPGSGATARFDSADYRIMGAADTAAINAANNLGKTARTGIMQFENAYLDFSKTKATELMNEYRSQMKHALSGEDGILSKLGEQASTAGQDTLDVSSKIQGELLKDYGKDSIVGNIFNGLVHDAENDFHVTAVDHQQKQVKWWKDTTDDKAMTLASEDAGNNYANEEKRTEKVAEAGFYARQKFARNGYSGLALDEAVREVESKAWYGVAKRAIDAGDINTAYSIYDQCSVAHRRQGPHDLTKIDGMIEGANVDLNNRKVLRTKDADGNEVIKTVQSMTAEFDGQHVVLPTIIDGKEYTPDQAFEHYRKTGEHLGKFKTKDAAEEYSRKLHENHAVEYGPGATYMTGDDLSKLRKEIEASSLKVLGERIDRGDMAGAEALGRTIKQGGVFSGDMSSSFAENTSKFSGKTGYMMGGRNPESGKVDCSGWGGYLLEKAGLDGFRGKNAEGLVAHAWKVGRRVDDNELFSNPKEGLVIGLDQGPKAHDRGRALGIDHVVVTYKDPSTGRIMVSESSGSKGVHATPVEDWISYHQKRGHKFFTGDVSGLKPRSVERSVSPDMAAHVDSMIEQGNAVRAADALFSKVESGDMTELEAMKQITAIQNRKAQSAASTQFSTKMRMKKLAEEAEVSDVVDKTGEFLSGIQDRIDANPNDVSALSDLWTAMKQAENDALTGKKSDKKRAEILKKAYRLVADNGISQNTDPAVYSGFSQSIYEGKYTSEEQLRRVPEFAMLPAKDRNSLVALMKNRQKVDLKQLQTIFNEVIGDPGEIGLDKEKKAQRAALWKAVQLDTIEAAKSLNSGTNVEWMRKFVERYTQPQQIPGLLSFTATTKTRGEFRTGPEGRDALPAEVPAEHMAKVTQVFSSNENIANLYMEYAKSWKEKHSTWAKDEDVARLLFYRSLEEGDARGGVSPERPKGVPDNAAWTRTAIGWGWKWAVGSGWKFEPYVFKGE